MSGAEDKKDELLKTPFGPEEPTTPYGTPEPSQPTAELHLSDRATLDIAQRFDLLAELGRGGMGIVYRARDRETSEIVALKILKPEIANRPNLIERFKTELRLARKITHKNVCRSYDLHRFGETVVIAMEYVEGESLRTVLSRPAGVSLRSGMNWASQVCAGLAEAHAQGIVHRDLKPENIVIDRSGQAKVMDFGIARSIDTTTTTGVITGTPAYMSPEQAEGKPADARSDIYSLGLILYEMFTGRPGLKAESPIALALKQIHETPPPPREVEPHLPPFLERVILRCLEKNPKQRFQSVAELEAALTETPEVKTPTAESAEISLPPHLAYWQRSDWTLLLGSVVAAALFLVLFYRFHPAPVMEVRVNEEQQKQIIVDKLKELNLDFESYDANLWFEVGDYYAVASEVGIQQAHEIFANETAVASWSGWLGSSHNPYHSRYEIDCEGRGRSLWLRADVAINSPPYPAPDAPALADMKAVGRRGLATYFGIDVSSKEPDKIVLPSAVGHSTTFVWKLRTKSGHLVDFSASVDGSGILTLERSIRIYLGPPFDFESYRPPQQYANAPIVIIIFALTLFFWQRVYRQGRPSDNLAIAIVIALCAATVTTLEISGPGDALLAVSAVYAVIFCLSLLLTHATLDLVLYYLRKRLPIQASNYSAFWRGGVPIRTACLELLRGIFAGMIFGGAWMGLMSLGGLWGKAFVGVLWNLTYLSWSMRGVLPGLHPVFILAEPVFVPWLLVALPFSLMAKVTTRAPVLIAVLVGLWLAIGFSLAGAMAFPRGPYYIVAALQAAFFGLIFLRYGLLATSSAVLTVETFLLAFPLFTILRNLYPLLLSIPFIAWFVMFLGAGAIYLQPQLATAYRRVTAVFE